jgi:CO dehydrogenase flavoprotein C-terminal domain
VAEEVELAFGGVAPKAIMAPKTEQALQGKAWEQPLLQTALEALAEDVNITANAPGAWRETHSNPSVAPALTWQPAAVECSGLPPSTWLRWVAQVTALQAPTHCFHMHVKYSGFMWMLAGGMVEFRRSLAASFLFRFVVHVNYALAVRAFDLLPFQILPFIVRMQSLGGDLVATRIHHTLLIGRIRSRQASTQKSQRCQNI